jgi:hypothetical protein
LLGLEVGLRGVRKRRRIFILLELVNHIEADKLNEQFIQWEGVLVVL